MHEGSARARLGLGANVSALINADNTATTIQSLLDKGGVTSTDQQAIAAQLALLDPSTLSTINSSVDDYSTLTHMSTLSAAISSGDSITPEMITGSLAVAATMTMGPIAGAAVAVAGEAVSLIFDAFSSPPPPPPPEWNYKGFLRLGQIQGTASGGYDPVPFGPKDSLWIDCSTSSKVIQFVQHGDAKRPAVDGNFSWGTAQFMAACLELVEQWPVYRVSRSIDGMNMSSDALAFYSHECWSFYDRDTLSAEDLSDLHSSIWTACQPFDAAAQKHCDADFAVFLAHMVAANLQLWANGQSYIPLYSLLQSCAAGWNSLHSDSVKAVFSGNDNAAYEVSTFGGPGTVTKAGFWNNPIYPIICGWDPDVTDPTQYTASRRPPITINCGELLSDGSHNSLNSKSITSSTSTTKLSTTAKVAIAVAAIPVVAVAGGAVYALATKQAVGGVLTSMGYAIATPFASAGSAIKRGAISTSRNVKAGAQRISSGAKKLVRRKNPLELEEHNPESMRVQTILFPRRLWTARDAKAWCRRHGYRHTKADITTEYIRVRQSSPKLFDRSTFRTIQFGDEIKAVVGRRL